MGKASRKNKKSDIIIMTLFPVLIIIALLIASHSRNTIWKDEITLWEDVVKKSPNKARGHYNLAAWGYYKEGFQDKALHSYKEALRLNPYHTKARFNLGIIYIEKGMLVEAKREFEMVLKIAPDDYETRIFLNHITNLEEQTNWYP